jgi:hypothetical protein
MVHAVAFSRHAAYASGAQGRFDERRVDRRPLHPFPHEQRGQQRGVIAGARLPPVSGRRLLTGAVLSSCNVTSGVRRDLRAGLPGPGDQSSG